jgi:serine/threonine protein kinase
VVFFSPAGGEIFDQIIRSGYMSEKVAAEKAGQLLSFLAHAHKKHVIHRFVKTLTTFSAGSQCSTAFLYLLLPGHRAMPKSGWLATYEVI